jgi:hypothetical protein
LNAGKDGSLENIDAVDALLRANPAFLEWIAFQMSSHACIILGNTAVIFLLACVILEIDDVIYS